MASLDAIAIMEEEVTRGLNAIIEEIGGRDAVLRVERAGQESNQRAYNEARRKQEMVRLLRQFLDSGRIKEDTDLESIDGIGPEVADALKARGIVTKDDLREASNEELMEIPGIGPNTAVKIRRQL